HRLSDSVGAAAILKVAGISRSRCGREAEGDCANERATHVTLPQRYASDACGPDRSPGLECASSRRLVVSSLLTSFAKIYREFYVKRSLRHRQRTVTFLRTRYQSALRLSQSGQWTRWNRSDPR